MIQTCDNCHMTFDQRRLQVSCPICGRKKIVVLKNNIYPIAVPAVRPATESETNGFWFVKTAIAV